MTNKELYSIVGGASTLSGTFINSVTKLITTILDIGRTVGSSIRYAIFGKKCS